MLPAAPLQCQVWPVNVCVCVTHNGTGLGNEEKFSQGSVKRQQHRDAGGILAQAVFHGHKELPQGPEQSQLTGSGVQTHRQTDKHRRNRFWESSGWKNNQGVQLHVFNVTFNTHDRHKCDFFKLMWKYRTFAVRKTKGMSGGCWLLQYVLLTNHLCVYLWCMMRHRINPSDNISHLEHFCSLDRW